MIAWLEEARTALAVPEGPLSKAAEWLQDNEYLVSRAVLQIDEDLPAGFYQRLPALAGPAEKATPRVLALSRALLGASQLQLSLQTVTRFVQAYQQHAPLTIAELWALPTLLRLVCLEVLVSAFERLAPTLRAPFRVEPLGGPPLEDTEYVARSLGNLRVIAAIPWKEFFEATSQVEAILRRDPAGVYSRMDFDTADRYRRAVERLGRATAHSELEVAERVVAYARPFVTSELRRGHVGFWLIDEGLEEFEQSLAYRAPVGVRMRRWLIRHAVAGYGAALALATMSAVLLPALYLGYLGATPVAWAIGMGVTLLPASAVGVTVVHWLLTQLLPPRIVPKIDFEKGISAQYRTAVVVPCLTGSPEEVMRLIERLEGHYLANPDPAAEFVLLSDFTDAPHEHMPGDAPILAALSDGIGRLNRRYALNGRGPFHVLHRPRRYNPAEECWMGWERKRGKLDEFNQFLLGDRTSAFAMHDGSPSRLESVSLVLTLDADTGLPRGSLARLAGILAHPLNRAAFDDATGRVRAGYTVVQPRVEIDPHSGNRSRFTRWFAGDTSIDIYSRAVSDIYQDLFGAGIYVGKGIYDVDPFQRSLEGQVPENALASHDLFEGIHGRTALATDVVLYESFPVRYVEFARRMHRWIRGDWQLLPWLSRRVPGRGGTRLPNTLAGIDRWKILDNLRRSLVVPSLVVMLAAGWLVLPGNPWIWTALGVLAPAGHLFTDLVTGFGRGRRRSAVRTTLLKLVDHAGRWALLIVFLPYEAWLTIDAIGRTCFRLFVTHRHLLQWTTAARTAHEFAGHRSRALEWGVMWSAPAIAGLLAVAIAWTRPAALPSAAPLLLLWFVAPEVAYRLGRPRSERPREISTEDRASLRQLARRTWFFFETFVGPEDQWLPPDNFQADPRGEVAHRTSPTNIGMMFLSSLAAFDLGYVGGPELSSRLANSLDSLKRLEGYRGHLFNWYDTRSLDPLEPRYVSTVDSGNLGASLLALKEGCLEIASGPAVSAELWNGLIDALALLESSLERVNGGTQEALRLRLQAMQERADSSREHPLEWLSTLHILGEREGPAFDGLLREAIDASGEEVEFDALRDVRVWLDRVRHHVRAMHNDLMSLVPWLEPLATPPTSYGDLAKELAASLPPTVPLGEMEARIAEARERVAGALSMQEPENLEWLGALQDALEQGGRAARELRAELLGAAAQAESTALAMDFRLLYDKETRLFHIGYNMTADRIDPHHYDLLASEARIASIFGIAKGDVPVEHWFHLGRPVTQVGSRLCLVSWGGSMFEYLMPPLLLRSEAGTLLAASESGAVDAQRRHGKEIGIPWGMSESGLAAIDADRNYRYRAFGVQALGLRRGLSEDSVVAPYATVLALGCDPVAAMENLHKLVELGLMGEYGFYEAADFTAERLPEGRPFAPVTSYMAHHQGMILAALDNALNDGVLVRRLHADSRVRSVELLLHERVPVERPLELLPRERRPSAPSLRGLPSLRSWTPRTIGSVPDMHVLGNGRLSSWISESGGGRLQWQDFALTRWTPDTTRDDWGLWTYVFDAESGQQWSAARQPVGATAEEAQVIFHPHLAEFHRRDNGIGLRMEVVVSPADDVEIRRFTIVNESDRPRTLTLGTYGEVVLAPSDDDARHPAFSKLFVRSAWLPGVSGLLFTRNPRGPTERPPVLLHRLVADDPEVQLVGFESDRRAFLGRGGDTRRPTGRMRSDEDSTGWTLDPILALRVRVELEPNQSRRLAFVTLASGSRESVLEVAERYQTLSSLDWVMDDAATEAARELQRVGLDPAQLPELQTLGSLLINSHRALRCDPRRSTENLIGQPQLGGMGLSGDLPILLVKTREPHEPALLDLVRGHAFWRRRGLAVDLVLLREGASGYAEPIRDHLVAMLRDLGMHEQLGRHGGIHLLIADQLGDANRCLLEVAAGAILDTGGGSLARRLTAVDATESELPDFSPTGWNLPHEPTPPLPRPTDLQFDNGFGGFFADGSEYVIFLGPGEKTPAPWSNVLANEEFGCLVTESGGGFTWAVNSGENRLTPFANDPVSDPPGEVLYLRDEETGRFWTPTPEPAGDATVAHEVRHGAGYTEWRSNSWGLEQSLRVFVPPDDPVKVICLRLRNVWGRPRRITATYYAEWVLGVMRSLTSPFLVPEYEAEHRALLVRNPRNPEFADRVAFLSSNLEPHGVTADRAEFLGREGELRAPRALGRWGLSGRVEPLRDPCAALQVHLDIEPGADAEVIFVLGQGRDRRHTLELLSRWRDPSHVERSMDELAADWEKRLGAVEVRTPDPAMDLMLNRWLLYQSMASRVLARSGFYQSGGAIGFRDQLQDSMVFVHSEPERLRSHLLECAAHQFEEGDVLHWWHPPSGRGVRTRCSDDLLWLPLATAFYVGATGDDAILDEPVPFLRDAPLRPEEEDRYAEFETGDVRPLFEHCTRALERGVTRGPHDLPLIGAGDWNDGMNRVGTQGRGESVWLGWFAIAAMQGFAKLCQRRGEADLERRWLGRSRELRRALEHSAWDGAWYRRAFDDDGRPLGSAESEECRIDSIAQSWSVLSRAGSTMRAREAVEAAERELVCEEDAIVRLLWPPFDKTLRDPGYIKAYPPGIRENGGQYTHAAAWLGWAFCELGEGDRAARIFRLINPIHHSGDREAANRYQVEPYVIAADVGGVPPHAGRGGWTWYTGSAVWTWRLGVEGMLGLRREEGGLRIDPCLPRDWPRVEARVRGPEGTLAITIENPEGVGLGVAELLVDGTPARDPIVPFPVDGSERQVVVRLGKR
jgi:cyclic beta-1,2-glucan synthetase